MKQQNVILLFSLLAIAACAGKETTQNLPGIDIYGGCTKEAVHAFKTVANKSEVLEAEGSVENAQSVKAACANLKSLVGEESCRGVNKVTLKSIKVSFESVRLLCEDADQLLETKSVTSQ